MDGFIEGLRTMTLVSIGVPVRNGANGIAAALASLSGQTHRNIEIIVSDNASSDDTVAIVKRAAEWDSRIRLIRQPRNIGMFGNFRAVRDDAKGEFFMWAAHDDERDADYVEKLLARLAAMPEAIVAMGQVFVVLPDRTARIAPDPSTMGLSLKERMHKTGRLAPFAMYGLWRTSVVRRIPLRDAFWSADTPVVLAAAAIGPLLYVPETRLIYRDTPKHFFRQPIAAIGSVPIVLMHSFRACTAVAGPLAGLLGMRHMLGVLWRQTKKFIAIRLGAPILKAER